MANSHGDDVSLCVVLVLCEEAHYTHYAVQRGLINHGGGVTCILEIYKLCSRFWYVEIQVEASWFIYNRAY